MISHLPVSFDRGMDGPVKIWQPLASTETGRKCLLDLCEVTVEVTDRVG